jgi:2,3-bisphosphoglycerate-independent phosphoglycerate mutase
MVLPDHATPVSVKTHVSDNVLFGVYGKGVTAGTFANYSEKEAEKSELFFEKGYELMDFFIKTPEI